MFSKSAHRIAWETNVAFFSAPLVWSQGGQVLSLNAAFAIGRETDLAVANALGVGVRKITIRAVDAGGRTPRPLDRLDIAGEALTVDAVVPIVFAGELYGWKCQCAGAEPGL